MNGLPPEDSHELLASVMRGSLDDLVADDLKPVQMIGDHRARQGTAPLGGGVVGIEVTKTSRVDVTASSVDGNTQKSYELAMRDAESSWPTR